jgi:hypothetical protein
MSETITLTMGDCAENHRSMQIIGKAAEKGISVKQLVDLRVKLAEMKIQAMLHRLDESDSDSDDSDSDDSSDNDREEAAILIIRDGVNALMEDNLHADNMFEEQKGLFWDSKALMYGRVVNKHARHNLCYAAEAQAADYAAGKGTIVPLSAVLHLEQLRQVIVKLINKPLVVEGNRYYDIKKCGIGYHGDTERRIVVGVRLGATMPICFRWYRNSAPISERKRFDINHGDIYFMSEKAVGFDWKRRKIATLRHAAGGEKFIA